MIHNSNPKKSALRRIFLLLAAGFFALATVLSAPANADTPWSQSPADNRYDSVSRQSIQPNAAKPTEAKSNLPANVATDVTPAGEWAGCPLGAACIYRDGHPDHLRREYITNMYWSYGAHNLVNQFGDHWVLNNQYGGPNATVVLCYGYNGTNCTGRVIPPGWAFVENLTPINSIVLNRP